MTVSRSPVDDINNCTRKCTFPASSNDSREIEIQSSSDRACSSDDTSRKNMSVHAASVRSRGRGTQAPNRDSILGTESPHGQITTSRRNSRRSILATSVSSRRDLAEKRREKIRCCWPTAPRESDSRKTRRVSRGTKKTDRNSESLSHVAASTIGGKVKDRSWLASGTSFHDSPRGLNEKIIVHSFHLRARMIFMKN